MLDVRRLQVLKAVIDAGSITAAAAVLGFTPSALSQSLAALEREAKTPLFEKVGRGLRPTDAGLLLAGFADDVAAQLRKAEDALEALRAGEAGMLRLAAFGTAGATLVPRALALFREDYPRLELDLSMAESDEALASLRARHVDVSLIAEHSDVGDEPGDLTFSHLLDDPYRIVLPRSHRAAKSGTVSLGQLSEDPWISTASARCNCLQTVTTACARAGFAPRFAVEADEFATTVGFVAAGLGVAMVPMLALTSVPGAVCVRPIAPDALSRRVYVVTRKGSAGHPFVDAIVGALRTSAGSYLKAVA
jgi:DNA-binding transcriptional LysR family regulator